jgi:uncharacterized membrane protein YgcG
MDLSSQRTPDEDRIFQRQLYRVGQSQAVKTPTLAGASSRNTATKGKPSNSGQPSTGQRILLMLLLLGVGYYLLCGSPAQRRKAWIGLGVAGWLLLLGSISYCLCLPDLAELNRQRRAVFEDKNLTWEQKIEKVREIESKLTPAERRQMRELSFKEMTRKRNADMYNFLQMSREEQIAQVKKEAAQWAEWAKRREQMRKARDKGGPRGNNNGGANGGKGNNGGGRGGGGWGGGGGPGGGPGAFLDRSSPEARAGGLYKMGLMQQMGLGGPGGGRR